MESRIGHEADITDTEALRIAFVGQATSFASCALDADPLGLDTTFVDFRAGYDPDKMLEALLAADPDVAIFFRPETVPPALLAPLDAVTVGFATEPLPSIASELHPDLAGRQEAFSHLDPANFDRMIVYNPGIVESVEQIMPVWRCLALPVNDRYYRDVRLIDRRPRVIFVGRSTDHIETMLSLANHHYDVAHIAPGAVPDELEPVVDAYDVGINLHDHAYLNFENRVPLHLAAAHLVLTEPLTPTMGLEPGIDYLEIRTPLELLQRIEEVFYSPNVYQRVRVRGRDKAELFRASQVYRHVVGDLLRDIAVFGSRRH